MAVVRREALGRPCGLLAVPLPATGPMGHHRTVSPPADLRAHLLAAGLAGFVGTSREDSLRSYRLFAARDPRLLIGIDPEWPWEQPDLLALMAEKCGVSADPRHTAGPDVIDPERTLAALDAFAERIGEVARRGAPVLFGTGHPQRLLGFYAGLADALSAAGCEVLTPAQGRCVDILTRFGLRTYRVDYLRGVALVREPEAERPGGEPGVHSHSPLPVRVVLEAAAERGGPLPELVVGITGGSAVQVSWGSRRSGRPTPMIRRRSWERPRDPCRSSFRLTTACARSTTSRSPATCSNERVCHSRQAMGAPLPHSHHPPLHWGVSTQRRRVTGRGSRWPSSAEGSGVSWLQLARGL